MRCHGSQPQGEEVSFLLMGIPACVTSEGQTAGSLSPVLIYSTVTLGVQFSLKMLANMSNG